MRIEVTTARMKLCSFVWMDQSSVCINLWLSPRYPWAVSSSMHTITNLRSFQFQYKHPNGDASQVFYRTLYTSKSTQDEDSKKQLHIWCAVINRIKRLLDENQTNSCDQTTSEPSFGEGLSRVLLGLNAATIRNVISSTMAHLISCNNWARFVFFTRVFRFVSWANGSNSRRTRHQCAHQDK